MEEAQARVIAAPDILEAQYAAIVRSATDAIVTVDQDRRIVVFNPAAEHVFRCRAVDVLGRSIDRFIPERFRSFHPARLRALDPSGTLPATLRCFPALRADGSEFLAEATLSQIEVGDGSLFTVILRDVTEREAAEVKHERAMTAFASVGEGIIMTDADGVIEYVNPAFERITGFASSEVIGRRRRDLQGTAYTGDFYEEVKGGASANGTWRGSLVTARKDGAPVELECTVAPVFSSNGTVVGYVGLEHDLTDRRRAERALDRQQQLLNAIIDSSNAVIYVKDADGRYLLVNRSYEVLRNLDRKDMIGRTDLDLFPAETAASMRANDQAVLVSGVPQECEEQAEFGGELMTFISLKFPLSDSDGAPYAICGISTDITERKRAQEEISRHADRLKSLSRQLIESQERDRKRVARELHDEVGQALTAVKVNLMAIRSLPQCDTVEERLSDSISIVDHALASVRSLSLDLRPSLLDDLGLASALRWYARRHAERTGLEIELTLEDVPEQIAPEIETQCFRIAQEALTNVSRHAGARHVEIRLQGRDGELALVVTDDGTGTDLLAAMAGVALGESSGLASMRERAELAGGRLEMFSEPGKGMRVVAYFALETTGRTKQEVSG